MIIKSHFKNSILILLGILLLAMTLLIAEVYADEESVTVYLTITDDSEFVTGNDAQGTTLARVPVKVEYRDLSELGLDEFKRKEACDFDDGGEYLPDGEEIKQPTVLMLLLRAVELYYLGRDLERSDIGTDAISIEGSAMHLFITKFFGHDLNFIYYHNHSFPKMNADTGATADYMLLEDGDEIDVAMFTDYSFHNKGCMAYFYPADSEIVSTGQPVNTSMLYAATSEESDGEPVPLPGETVKMSTDYGKTWFETSHVTDESGNVALTFDDPGVYLISAGPHFKYMDDVGAEKPCVGPPIGVVRVKPDTVTGLTQQADEVGISLSWDPVSGASGYTVEYKKAEEDTWSRTDVYRNRKLFYDLDWDTEYLFRVKPFINSKYVTSGDEDDQIYGQTSDIVSARTTIRPSDSEMERIAEEIVASSESALEDARSKAGDIDSAGSSYQDALQAYTSAKEQAEQSKEEALEAAAVPDQASVRAAARAKEDAEAAKTKADELVTAAEALRNKVQDAYDASLSAAELSERAKGAAGKVSDTLLRRAEALLREAESLITSCGGKLESVGSKYSDALTSQSEAESFLADAEQALADAEEAKAEADAARTAEELAEEDLKDAATLKGQVESAAALLEELVSDLDESVKSYQKNKEEAEELYKAASKAAKTPGSKAVKAAEEAEKKAEALEGSIEAFTSVKQSVDNAVSAIERLKSDFDDAVTQAEKSSAAAYGSVTDEVAQLAEYRGTLESLIADLKTRIAGSDGAMTSAETDTAKLRSDAAALASKAKKDLAALTKARKAAGNLKVKGLKVKSKSRKFTLSWRKTKGASGYQVQYRLKKAKKFKTLKTLKKIKVKSGKLRKGKKYQFRVRTYKTVSGARIYGKWTKVKTVKCK